MIRPDGTGVKELTHGGGSGYHDSNPAWSPDSTRIVFTRDEQYGHDTDLYSVTRDGTDERAVSALDTAQDDASWQPVR